MDERIDILDSNGNFTGKTAMKSEAHKSGWFHPTIHVWFYTIDGKVLIQQRAKDKDTHPLLWDVSVAGHIGAGEEIERSAIREISEEIGVSIATHDLEKIGVFKSIQRHHDNLIDYEFQHSFLCELKTPFKSLRKQDSEVEALDLIPLHQFAHEIKGNTNSEKYVPHSLEYYTIVITAIKERL